MNIKNIAPSNIKERQRILVMDSNQDMLMLLNRTLELEGYDTVVVVDYDEAVDMMEKINPDMVIMDTYLPDIDCLKILDIIRQRSDIPIIVITADNELETLRTVFAHGADDFIRKPFGIKPLIARIKAKLRRYNGEILAPT
ncbi:MAG: response regulator transcription factor [Dehalococcoidales bacterium]|nr:response regulator transcription factor [Dehalococcoidales bacterium]